MSSTASSADVCLIMEGAYPYVAGGVSSWAHDLMAAHSDLTFHVVALVPDQRRRTSKYEFPPNMTGCSDLVLQQIPAGGQPGSRSGGLFGRRRVERLIEDLALPLAALQAGGGLAELAAVHARLLQDPDLANRDVLLDSESAWDLLTMMYEATLPGGSFLEYFWSWRALMGGLFATLAAPLPQARVYHTVSTGYAGLFAARARLETGRPALLTEHGIYTNERRIEITMAEWLHEGRDEGLGRIVARERRDLRDVWIDAFRGYARATYEASDEIVTLYTGNQVLQRRDGAPEERLRIIPNGIDYERFSKIEHSKTDDRPTVALIGRVVPIKDVKTYIRACARLRDHIPNLRALIMGPTEEDEDYADACRTLVRHLALEETIEFTGRVSLMDYLGGIDAIVLTSLSEAQPLVILEAGAAGIPSVTTDVGSCAELIHGAPDEDPKLGAGGAVTPSSSPAATAEALRVLLTEPGARERAGEVIRQRVAAYYDKRTIDHIYRDLYEDLRTREAATSPLPAYRPVDEEAA